MAGLSVRSARPPRPLFVVMLAAFDVAAGLLAAPLIAVLEKVAPWSVLLPGLAGVFGGLCWAAAVAVWRMTPRGRTLQLIVCGTGLVLVPPVTTIVFLPLLLLVRRPGARLLFSGTAPSELSEADRLEMDAFVRRTTRLMTVPLVAMAVLYVVAFASVFLLELNWQRFDQAILANEERTLRDVRALSAVEQAHAKAHYGDYELPARLPDAQAGLAGPSEGQWSGYVRRFYPGRSSAAETIDLAAPSAPSSLRSFAYMARPIDQGITGRRTFCVDATGSVRFTLEDHLPDPVDGACPRTMLFLPEAVR